MLVALHRGFRRGNAPLIDLIRDEIHENGTALPERDRMCQQAVGRCVLTLALVDDGQIVQRDLRAWIQLERGAIRRNGARRVEIPGYVVIRFGQIPLELGEAAAIGEGVRGGGDNLRRIGAHVVFDGRTLAPDHRETRVAGGRGLEQLLGGLEAAGIGQAHGLRILAQRFERAGGDLLQRVVRANGDERLADPLAQRARQAVECRDEFRFVRRGFADRGERRAVRDGNDPGREQVAFPNGIDLAIHDRLDAVALRDLSRQFRREWRGYGVLHAQQRSRNRLAGHELNRGRLREVNPERFREGHAERGVRGAIIEVSQNDRLTFFEYAGRHQGTDRADAEQ